MADKYQALLAKLKEATGPFCYSDAFDRALMLYKLDSQEGRLLRAALLGRIDATGAALALVEMTLPGWRLDLELEPNGTKRARLLPSGSTAWREWHGAKTPALAILRAWCEAMTAKEQA